MTERVAHAQKLMVLGVDGLAPRFSKRMIDAGKMPNHQKLMPFGPIFVQRTVGKMQKNANCC